LRSNNPLQQLATDTDSITCARDILLQLPVNVHTSKEWVKGHYTGKKKALKHILNDMADQLATDYNSFQRPINGTMSIPSPISKVELLHRGMIITSRLPYLIKEARHTDALKACVLKQTGWNDNIFQKVDFLAHKQAFTSHNRIHRISVSKLIHGLYQTKLQDHQFYGTSPICPCCHSVNESLNHISCPSKEVTEHRETAIQTLEEGLYKIGTPHGIIHSIVHGILTWTISQSSHNQQIRAPTRGSIKTSDVLLTQAFTEQTIDVGWDQFLRGRVSFMWGKAFSANRSLGTRTMESSIWVKRMILKVWDYSISLRKFRNGIVHGTTKQENIKKCLAELRTKVSEKYAEYSRDPFIFSPKFNSLFLKKSLEDRLKMCRDSLSSWLRSIKEVEVYQGVFRMSLAKAAKRFYHPQSRSGSKVDPHDSIVRNNSIVNGKDANDGVEIMNLVVEISSDLNVKTAEFDPG
jgi:hypothetical protein